MKKKFSLVIPTYTGQEHIEDCLDSVLSQSKFNKYKFEIVIVIDGPNKKLEEIVNAQKTKFQKAKIAYRIFKFKKNRGRFEARLKGAEMAKYPYLLFLDDRNILDKNYFAEVLKADKDALIPNVLENSHPHFVARTIFLLRKKAYKGKWGKDFKSYEITPENFEQSSKGTTSFWVRKDIFISVCQKVSSLYKDLSSINEDTKIMREIVENYTPIFRSSEAKIYYQPRQSAIEELKHIYNRGPRFIDYYLKPGTRFFWPLVGAGLSPMLILLLAVFQPQALLFLTVGGLLGFFTITILIKENLTDMFRTLLGLILLVICFYAGVLNGLVSRAIARSK